MMVALLGLGAEHLATGQLTTAEKPPDVSPAMKRLIGDYQHGADTLIVLERGGQLLIREGDRERPYAKPAGFARVKTAAVYRIRPQRPVAQITAEVRQATPPTEAGRERPVLVELVKLEPSLKLDIRYATRDNFLGTPVYSEGRAFMEQTAAAALARAHRALAKHGYGLLIHDSYRPWWVTKLFWEATSEREHEFVANPASGSRHNRGSAVDLTLFDRASGRAIEMPGGYDEMSKRSYPTYPGGTSLQRWHRDLLRAAMEQEGFRVHPSEWWHFDFRGWERFAIENLSFEQIKP
jgi:D-alanyl-D-alanine dipeptidase